jgi:hypothetical protein
MRIVARQNHNLAAAKDKVLSIRAFDADVKFAFDDIMINDQVGRRPERRPAVLTRHPRCDAPRGEEISVQEDAAGQMGHPQDIR